MMDELRELCDSCEELIARNQNESATLSPLSLQHSVFADCLSCLKTRVLSNSAIMQQLFQANPADDLSLVADILHASLSGMLICLRRLEATAATNYYGYITAEPKEQFETSADKEEAANTTVVDDVQLSAIAARHSHQRLEWIVSVLLSYSKLLNWESVFQKFPVFQYFVCGEVRRLWARFLPNELRIDKSTFLFALESRYGPLARHRTDELLAWLPDINVLSVSTMFDFLGLWKGYLLATNWVELHPLPLCKSLCSYVQNVAVRTAADLVTSRKEKLKTLELWETSIDSVKTDAVLMRALLSLGMISVINLPDNSGILVEFNDSQTVRCPGLLLKTLRQTPGPPSVSTSEVVQVISTEAFPVETDLQLHARLFEIIQRLRFEAEDLTTRLQVLHSENMLWTERRILQCDPSKHCDSWREFSASKASLDVAKTQAEKQQLVLQKLEEGESSADVINAIREQLHEVAAAQDCVDQARAELRKKEPDWKHQEYEYQRKRQRDTIVFEHYQTLLGADIDNVEKERHRLRAGYYWSTSGSTVSCTLCNGFQQLSSLSGNFWRLKQYSASVMRNSA
eukprot:GHVQ01010262.1.p1 GENE.GHVQ01010262.1~~GHVQ01010262.1.p1  ORF type:complete len:571 (-),score=50.37 GHVQ01010262.1:567-2279(-)